MEIDRFSYNVINLLNDIRENPSSFVQELEKEKKFFSKNFLKLPNEQYAIKTKEGAVAYEDAINYLNTSIKYPKLKMHKSLFNIAFDYLCDIENVDIGKFNSIDINKYVNTYGNYIGNLTKLIDFGGNSPKRVITNFIVNDGDKNRGQRQRLFNKNAKYIGVANGEHPIYNSFTVVIITNDFKSWNKRDDAPVVIEEDDNKEDDNKEDDNKEDDNKEDNNKEDNNKDEDNKKDDNKEEENKEEEEKNEEDNKKDNDKKEDNEEEDGKKEDDNNKEENKKEEEKKENKKNKKKKIKLKEKEKEKDNNKIKENKIDLKNNNLEEIKEVDIKREETKEIKSEEIENKKEEVNKSPTFNKEDKKKESKNKENNISDDSKNLKKEKEDKNNNNNLKLENNYGPNVKDIKKIERIDESSGRKIKITKIIKTMKDGSIEYETSRQKLS